MGGRCFLTVGIESCWRYDIRKCILRSGPDSKVKLWNSVACFYRIYISRVILNVRYNTKRGSFEILFSKTVASLLHHFVWVSINVVIFM